MHEVKANSFSQLDEKERQSRKSRENSSQFKSLDALIALVERTMNIYDTLLKRSRNVSFKFIMRCKKF